MQPDPKTFPATRAAGHTSGPSIAHGFGYSFAGGAVAYAYMDRWDITAVHAAISFAFLSGAAWWRGRLELASAPDLAARCDALEAALREIRRILDDEDRRMFAQLGDIRDEVNAALAEIEGRAALNDGRTPPSTPARPGRTDGEAR